MRSKWLNILVIVFTAILWAIQMIPAQKEGEIFFLPYLREYKYYIAFASFALVILYHLYDIFVEREHIQKKWIKKFLSHIVYLDLGGDNYHTRVSILRPKWGYQIFIKRVLYFIIQRFIENFKKGTWKQSFRQIPIHLFSKYLIVYQRYSYPQEKKSYTYFRDYGENGVAVKCYREGIDCAVNTTCISDIDLPEKFSGLKGTNLKRVKKYMKDSFIDEQNYDTLLTMGKRANNIYATPIIIEQKVWGVLIIDNDEQDEVVFKKMIDPVIERYIKLFVFTIGHLKMK